MKHGYREGRRATPPASNIATLPQLLKRLPALPIPKTRHCFC